jgi:hypothetical protein
LVVFLLLGRVTASDIAAMNRSLLADFVAEVGDCDREVIASIC